MVVEIDEARAFIKEHTIVYTDPSNDVSESVPEKRGLYEEYRFPVLLFQAGVIK